MDSTLHYSSRGTSRWRKRPSILYSYRMPLLISLFFIVALFVFSRILTPHSLLPLSRNSGPQCLTTISRLGEKYLWYAPHSGFSNQLSEFKNAILMAAILNRTLIVPPVLDHHAVALGSCPKFRVLNPNDLRFKVWNHSIELIRDRRYISMADIIDLSALTSASAVRFIDLRNFMSMWCQVNLSFACSADSSTYASLLEKLKRCGSLLSGYHGNVEHCLFASQEDCRTTVWSYQTDDDWALDSFQADDELKRKKKISYLRKRRDVYNALGPSSAAGQASVLSFGSLFTAPYKGSESHIDIHDAPRDQSIQSILQKIDFLPFVSEILNSGKKFAIEIIKAPFLCAQLRLLDGQFKNHWEVTFLGMKQRLDSLKRKGYLPIHVFVMTDLPQHNWTGTYLGHLAKDSDSFKMFVLREEDELVAQTAAKLVNSGNGREQKYCNARSLPDILLYMEQTICSCATLGFVGTAGSTIAESIELMRRNHICSL